MPTSLPMHGAQEPTDSRLFCGKSTERAVSSLPVRLPGIEIIKEGDRLVVVSATGERARLSVYDITGKAIVTAVVSDGDCVTVPGKGVCIVALVTDDGNCTTHKFLF